MSILSRFVQTNGTGTATKLASPDGRLGRFLIL